MLYNVTNDFAKIGETSGTIQNTSHIYSVEVSDKAEENSGILLYPLNKMSFDGDIYARCVDTEGAVEARVITFEVTDIIGSSSYAGGSSCDGYDFATFEDIENLLNGNLDS